MKSRHYECSTPGNNISGSKLLSQFNPRHASNVSTHSPSTPSKKNHNDKEEKYGAIRLFHSLTIGAVVQNINNTEQKIDCSVSEHDVSCDAIIQKENIDPIKKVKYIPESMTYLQIIYIITTILLIVKTIKYRLSRLYILEE